MNDGCRMTVRTWMALAAGIALAITLPAWAQDEGDAPKAKPAAKKAKAPAAHAATPKDTMKQLIEATKTEDPAVAALLAAKPSTPAQWVETARTLNRLHRPELAKPFLKKILAAKLDDKQLAALSEELGSSTFTELTLEPALRPESQQLMQAVLGAVNRQLQDTKRIADLIKQLQDASPDVRGQAMVGLGEAHTAAVVAMIGVLADPARTAEHPIVKAALAEMSGESLDPLLGVLDQADPQLAVQAIGALSQVKSPTVAVWLLAPALSDKSDPKVRAAAAAAITRLIGRVPSKQEAVQLLAKQALSYFQQRETLKPDATGRVKLWQWDPKTKQCVAVNSLPEAASRAIAARLARAILSLSPDDPRTNQFCLTAILDEAADRTNDPAVLQVTSLGPAAVQSVLDYAMAENHPVAARVAAEILGRTGKAKELLGSQATPSPLVRAVRSPDRRLRLAALEAIVRLTPDFRYAGSSHVVESLAQLAATGGTRRAIVVGPNMDAMQEWIGLLGGLGFQVDSVFTGREAMRLATNSPDYELILIDMATGNADALLQQLRQDYRTAATRVGLIARSGDFEHAERIAREDRQAMALPRPRDRKAAAWQMQQLSTIAPGEYVGFEERQQQADRALACLATLASTSRKLYDTQRIEDAVAAATHARGLGIRAAAVLANVGTPESQLSLVDLASRIAQPIDVRQAAAKAFQINTGRYGVLLPRDAVNRQTLRYTQSDKQDADTRAVLKSILDSIEAGRSEKSEKTEK